MWKISYSYVKSLLKVEQKKYFEKNVNFAKMNFERGHANRKMIAYDI